MVSKDVPPHRDFFTVQFLLGIWTSGVTNLSVETSIIDENERDWITGPKTSLSVKVYDELGAKSQTQANSSSSTPTGNRAQAQPLGTLALQSQVTGTKTPSASY